MKNLLKKIADMIGKQLFLPIFTSLVLLASICEYFEGGIIPSAIIFSVAWAVVISIALTNKDIK